MNRLGSIILSVFLLTGAVLHASPVALPADYKDYGLLEDSFSPDHQFAMMCIRREVLDQSEDSTQRLFLVAADVFRVVTEIPVHNSDLLRGHSSYAVKWTPDSSAVLVAEGIKWGPDKVYLVPIRRGQPGKIVDLTAEVEQRVRPDYQKFKTERDGRSYDFLFDEDGAAGDGFAWDKDKRVIIDCVCTTNPKQLNEPSWTVRFCGSWDVAKDRMVKASFKHLQRKPLD